MKTSNDNPTQKSDSAQAAGSSVKKSALLPLAGLYATAIGAVTLSSLTPDKKNESPLSDLNSQTPALVQSAFSPTLSASDITAYIQEEPQTAAERVARRLAFGELQGHKLKLEAASDYVHMHNHALQEGVQLSLNHVHSTDGSVVEISNTSVEAQIWLRDNGYLYGFFPAFHKDYGDIDNIYNHQNGANDLPAVDPNTLKQAIKIHQASGSIYATVLQLKFQYDATLLTQSSSSYDSLTAAGLCNGLVIDGPRQGAALEGQLSFSHNAERAAIMLQDLLAVGAVSYDVVPLEKTIVHTLRQLNPELSEKEIQALGKATVELNVGVDADFNPHRLQAKQAIVIPRFPNSLASPDTRSEPLEGDPTVPLQSSITNTVRLLYPHSAEAEVHAIAKAAVALNQKINPDFNPTRLAPQQLVQIPLRDKISRAALSQLQSEQSFEEQQLSDEPGEDQRRVVRRIILPTFLENTALDEEVREDTPPPSQTITAKPNSLEEVREYFDHFDFARHGNPFLGVFADVYTKLHPAKGGGNCGGMTSEIFELSGIPILQEIAKRDLRDASGKRFYPDGSRDAYRMHNALLYFSNIPDSGIIRVPIEKISEHKTGYICTYPGRAGLGKRAEQFKDERATGNVVGHIELCIGDLYAYDLRTSKWGGRQSIRDRYQEQHLDTGKAYAFVCTQTPLDTIDLGTAESNIARLMDRDDAHIPGFIPRCMESGSDGAAAIGNLKGDKGGKSYGPYQLATGTGSLQDFLDKSGWKDRFGNLEPGTNTFDAKWREFATAGSTKNDFLSAQQHYHEERFFPAARRVAERCNVDIDADPRLREMCISLVNQHSSAAQILQAGLSAVPEQCDGMDIEMKIMLANFSRKAHLVRWAKHSDATGNTDQAKLYRRIAGNRIPFETAFTILYNGSEKEISSSG